MLTPTASARGLARASARAHRPLARQFATVQDGGQAKTRTYGGLKDEDRIFQNLYGKRDPYLKSASLLATGTRPRRSCSRATTGSSQRSRRRACAAAAAPASRRA
jgi:hypothetical protein